MYFRSRVATQTNSIKLGARMHTALFQYASLHLTRDYVGYTEEIVAKLFFDNFRRLPLQGPSDLGSRLEPFHALANLPNSREFVRFEETLCVKREVAQQIKRAHLSHGHHFVEGVLTNTASNFPRAILPLLTLCSARESPPSRNPFASLPASAAKMSENVLKSSTPKPVVEGRHIEMENVIDLQLTYTSSAQAGMVMLIKCNPFFVSRVDTDPNISRTGSSPRRSAPTDRPVRCELLPLFARGSVYTRHIEENTKVITNALKLLARSNPPTEEELYLCNMDIVDVNSRQVDRFSPPPSASHPDVVDAASLVSPCTARLLVHDIAAARMDDILIPKHKRHNITKTLQPTIEASLGEFLAPLRQMDLPSSIRLLIPAVQHGKLCHGIPGGKPSTLQGSDMSDREIYLDITLKKLVKHDQSFNVEELILNEKVDDKNHLLMDVALLSPPNDHQSSSIPFPAACADLVIASDVKSANLPETMSSAEVQAYLKKAKGVKSISLGLSWIPFVYEFGKPTHDDLLAVSILGHQFGTLYESPARTRHVSSDEYQLDICLDFDPSLRGRQMVSAFGFGQQIGDGTLPFRTTNSRNVHALMHNSHNLQEDAGETKSLTKKARRLSREPKRNDDVDDLDIPRFTETRTGAGLYPSMSDSAGDEDKENSLPSQEQYMDTNGCSVYGYCGVEPFKDTVSGSHNIFPGNLRSTPEAASQADLEEEDSQPLIELPSMRGHLNSFSPRFYQKSDAIIRGLIKDQGPANFHTVLAKQTIFDFAALRGKTVSKCHHSLDLDVVPIPPTTDNCSVSSPRSVPDEFLGGDMFQLPGNLKLPNTLRHYLASLELMQKQALVRHLRSPNVLVDLIEHDTLCGVDLVMDPHTSAVLVPLFSLPSECPALCSRIGLQSWQFLNILIIFEAYPIQASYRPQLPDMLISSPFTAPILKAVQKLRRNLAIANAYGLVCPRSRLQLAFARKVEEAAMLIREFGDWAESFSGNGGL